MLEPGWLERQFNEAQREREHWPEWLKRARELRTVGADTANDASRIHQAISHEEDSALAASEN